MYSVHTIDYEDTSHKKYPFNKYYNCRELASLSKRVFDSKKYSHTIDVLPKKSSSIAISSKRRKSNKKSIVTANTMNSSRANVSLKHKSIHQSKQENYRQLKKDQIFEELSHYKQLCLKLRKENYLLKQTVNQQKIQNKETLIKLQEKINKLHQKKLNQRKKQLQIEEQQINSIKKAKKKKDKNNDSNESCRNEFKRFFLHFLDNFGKIDEKLQRKIWKQKSMQSKLLLGRRVLKESSQFLANKKFKCNSIYQ